MSKYVASLLIFATVLTHAQTSAPQVVSIEKPEHPAVYLDGRVTGWARVECVVNEDGSISEPKVTAASMPEFGSAAITAIRRTVFKPALVDGRPVKKTVGLPVDFAFSPGQRAEFERTRQKEEMPPGPPIFEDTEVDDLPVLLKEIRPMVPPLVKERRILSSAVLGFIVDEEGQVRDLHVKEMTLPGCGTAALAAVRQWQFQPGRKDGQTVRVKMEVTMVFFPENEKASGVRVRPGIRQDFSGIQNNVVQEAQEAARRKQPVLVKSREPNFPDEMKDRGRSGAASLEYIVGPSGRVIAVRTTSATNSYFAIEAERAVCEWVFRPGMIDGRPVATLVAQEFHFTMRR